MKKNILIILYFIGLLTYSQIVIIPNTLQAQRGDEDYQLKTFLKYALDKRGIVSVFASDLTKDQISMPCNYFFADVVEENDLFATILKITISDCQKKIVSASNFGVSKEKEYKKAYQMAFREAEKSLVVNFIPTQIIDKQIESTPKPVDEKSTKEVSQTNSVLYAQPINNGFQLINDKPEVVCKIYKTSQPKNFIIQKSENFGIGYLEDNLLIIEYYKANQLMKEVLVVKF